MLLVKNVSRKALGAGFVNIFKAITGGWRPAAHQIDSLLARISVGKLEVDRSSFHSRMRHEV